MKRLIGTLDTLQQQQAHAEARRHEVEQAAAGAAAEAALLQAQLHTALARAAELDDSEQVVQAALDARLQVAAAAAEQLKWVVRRAPAGGAAACCMAAGCAVEHWQPSNNASRSTLPILAFCCPRLSKRRLSGLRAESSGAAEELRQKQELAAELQAKLRAAGGCCAGLLDCAGRGGQAAVHPLAQAAAVHP